MSWQPEGSLKGPKGDPGDITTGVASVFGRAGVVVAQKGDYNYNQLAGGVATVNILYLDLQSNIDAATPGAKARLVGTATGCQLEYYDTPSSTWKIAQMWP